MMTPAAYGLLALVSVASVFGTYFAWRSYERNLGVQTERARVETTGKKYDAKAHEVRQKVEQKKPPEISADLKRYCRDC